ncbi:cation transporter [Euhalothece natronophila Z-M001]|uniref:Cation transporter n=1 Tax=Euhalothece natronophila Z-M001 TaxID=522448 RepID=A0A5B8NLA1_9CHRO|nr:cation diffusion facilitator family transporter [Euhalothece natronophila]QDZ39768.1 cation transporter [Euhalothece natronophila Z-M001]
MFNSCPYCQSPHTIPKTSNYIFMLGALLNIGFVVVEVFFGLTSHSLALLADAGHNASDVLGLLLAWGAQWLSQRPATEKYTYGFRRASILAALANAVVLLLVMGGITIEAIERLIHPSLIAVETTIAVAAVGIIINGGTAALFARGNQNDLNVRGVFWHVTADALISLKVVLVGLLITQTNWMWLDPFVSLVIALIIIYNTVKLLKQSLDFALDAVPPSIEIEQVKTFLQDISGVTEVNDLHIWPLSTTETALSVRLTLPEGHPGDDFLRETSQKLKEEFAIDRATIQIEIEETPTIYSLANSRTCYVSRNMKWNCVCYK